MLTLLCKESKQSKGCVKRGLWEGCESRNRKRQRVDPIQNKTYTENLKKCADILDELMSHKFGWVFNVPVDPVKLKIPDYFKTITEPMDLGTIKTRLEQRCYSSPVNFAADVKLTFANAMKYNPPTNDVHKMAVTLKIFKKELFERKWSIVETRLSGEEVYKKITQGVQLIPTKKQPGKNKISEIESNYKQKVASGAKSISASTVPFKQKPKAEICRPPMSFTKKAKLRRNLEELSVNMSEQVYTFLKKHTGFTQCDDEVEVAIECSNDNNLWELQILVSNYLRDRGLGEKCLQVSEPVKLLADSRDVIAASIKSSSSTSSSSSDSRSSSNDSDSESSSDSVLVTDEVHDAEAHPEGGVDFTTGNKQVV